MKQYRKNLTMKRAKQVGTIKYKRGIRETTKNIGTKGIRAC